MRGNRRCNGTTLQDFYRSLRGSSMKACASVVPKQQIAREHQTETMHNSGQHRAKQGRIKNEATCGRMENRLNEFFFVPKSIKIHLDDLLRTVCEAVVVQRELVSCAAENLEVACRCR